MDLIEVEARTHKTQFEGEIAIALIALCFILGNRVKPRITGGLVPVFRLKPEYPNVIFGIGVNYGFGLDIKVASNFAMHSQLVWYSLPCESIYDNYNYNEIDTNWWPSVMFKLGVSHKLKLPAHNAR